MISVTYHDTTTITAIDQLLCSVTISGDAQQAARKMSVTVQGTADGVSRLVAFEKGCELRAFNAGKELFRGVIFADAIDGEGKLTLTACAH